MACPRSSARDIALMLIVDRNGVFTRWEQSSESERGTTVVRPHELDARAPAGPQIAGPVDRGDRRARPPPVRSRSRSAAAEGLDRATRRVRLRWALYDRAPGAECAGPRARHEVAALCAGLAEAVLPGARSLARPVLGHRPRRRAQRAVSMHSMHSTRLVLDTLDGTTSRGPALRGAPDACSSRRPAARPDACFAWLHPRRSCA